MLRSEVRAGYGVIVGLESTPAQQAAGMPPLRYAALRGFRQGAQPAALLVDPYAAAEDFDTETELLVDYLEDARRLQFTVAADIVHNPAARSIWIEVDGDRIEIPGGATVQLS